MIDVAKIADLVSKMAVSREPVTDIISYARNLYTGLTPNPTP